MEADKIGSVAAAGRRKGSSSSKRVLNDQSAPANPGKVREYAGGQADGHIVVIETQAEVRLERGIAALPQPEAAIIGSSEAEPLITVNEAIAPEWMIAQSKDKIMANSPIQDDVKQAAETVSATVAEAMTEAQNRAKVAYEKGSVAVGELSEFAKGNAEAVVESSKIFASGIQEIGRGYAEEAKAAYEQMTADLKDLAAVKSPTELFQLQGKIVRRNFDAFVAHSSKSSEALMKLANEAFAPLSGRMNAAAEKISKVS